MRSIACITIDPFAENMQCYNTVNFLYNTHNGHPKNRPRGQVENVCCEFSVLTVIYIIITLMYTTLFYVGPCHKGTYADCKTQSQDKLNIIAYVYRGGC